MIELAWAALSLCIAAVLFLGFIAWIRDGYVMLAAWRAEHRRSSTR